MVLTAIAAICIFRVPKLASNSLGRLGDELSLSQATAKAESFLRQLGYSDPPEAAQASLIFVGKERRWSLTYDSVGYLYLQPKSGRGAFFAENDHPAQEPPPVVANPAIQTREALKASVQEVLARLPGGDKVRIKTLVNRDNGGELPRRAMTVFQAYHNNMPVIGASGEMTTNTHTGKVVAASIRWYFRIESNSAQVSELIARSRAREAYRLAVPDHLEAQFGEDNQGELIYVIPNGGFKGIRYPEEETKRARIAYKFKVGEDTIWIDAVNGSTLGGGGSLAYRFETPRPPSP